MMKKNSDSKVVELLENRIAHLESLLTLQNQTILKMKETDEMLISQLALLKASRTSEQNAFTLEEAAKFTGYSPSYMARLVAAKEIPFYKRPNRSIFFLKCELLQWVEKRNDKRIRHSL